jgi:hypothetical protein
VKIVLCERSEQKFLNFFVAKNLTKFKKSNGSEEKTLKMKNILQFERSTLH